MKNQAKGFAVVGGGSEVLVRTVSPTAIGATVNWLYTYAQILALNTWSQRKCAGSSTPPETVRKQRWCRSRSRSPSGNR